MRSLARRLHIRGAVKLYWFSADIIGVGYNFLNQLRIDKESAGLRRNQQESIIMMQLNARNCRNDPCDSSEVGFDSFLF